MAFFVLIGRDGPRGAELRKLHREAHLKGLESLEAEGRIRHAGPILDAAGQPAGSVVVFEAESLAAAQALAAGDPYVTEGVFEHHEVAETKVVVPKGT
jgi:uncharacterized protein YciI